MNLLSELILNPDLLAHGANQWYLKIDLTGKVIKTANVEETDPTVPSHVKAITVGQISNWDSAYSWGNHAGLYSLSAHTHTFASLTSKPTTIGGYGITDFNSLGDARWSLTSHNHTLDGLSNTTITSNTTGEILKWSGTAWINNTLAEAGIQPAGSYAAASHTHTWAQITDAPTKISLAELNAATATTDRLVDSKNLNDWLTPKLAELASGSNGYTEENFTYVASNVFTLAQSSPVAMSVYRNGRRLTPTLDFTVSGNQLTIIEGLNPGNEVFVSYFYSILGLSLSGSGTTNYIPKWSSSSVLGNSILQEAGANILISGNAAWHAGNFDPTTKANVSHTHSTTDITNLSSYTGFDTRYYTETEVNTLLSGYSLTSHNHTLDSLSNVTITTNSIGEILLWSGTAWINNTLAEAGIQAAGSYGLATADITAVGLTTTTLTLTRAAGNLTASVPTWNQSTTGSAATLTTTRAINGTNFNGSAAITTANWGTARVITIGSTGKSVNGSTTYSWTLAEIGAQATIAGTLTNGHVATIVAGVPTWAVPAGGGGGGSVTSITAGTGLTGGVITTVGTIAIDTTWADTRYVTLQGGSTIEGAKTFTSPISNNSLSTRDKYRVFGVDPDYAIGMQDTVNFGNIVNSWAMTFQMSNHSIRGFWWGDSAHTTSQGAMALTTDGYLTVATSVIVGYGESYTTKRYSYALDVNGHMNLTGDIQVYNQYGLYYDTSNRVRMNTSFGWEISSWLHTSILGKLIVSANLESLGQIYSNGSAKGTVSGTVNFDWDQGNVQTVTLGGNCTFTFSNPRGRTSYQIIITQDTTGSRTITWPTIHWAGKTVPSLTGTGLSVDTVTFTWDGSKYIGATITKNHGTP